MRGITGSRHLGGFGVTQLGVILALSGCSCQERPNIVSPHSVTGKVGQPFNYKIVADHAPTAFGANVPPPGGLSVDSSSGVISGVPSQAGLFTVVVRAKNGSGEDTQPVTVTIAPLDSPTEPPEPTELPHEVLADKELMITDPAVLGAPQAQPGGVWHIRSAMQRIAGTGVDVDIFANAWFDTWRTATKVDPLSDTFTTRVTVANALRDAWAANRIKLIAIVNRLDLARFADGDLSQTPTSLGEGRFVYEVNGSGGPLPFTIIFEYKLPITGDASADARTWAKRWHALGRAELGGPNEFGATYLAELATVTQGFSQQGMLNQIRTNEIVSSPWQLREFHFSASPASLVQVPVGRTPRDSSLAQPLLAAFINSNQVAIRAGDPVDFGNALHAAVTTVPNPSFEWAAPGAEPRALAILSFNSCNGCHAGSTGTTFQHVTSGGKSPFLAGPITLDAPLPPEANTATSHDEMAQRRAILDALAAPPPAPSAVAAVGSRRASPDVGALLRARAGRPH